MLQNNASRSGLRTLTQGEVHAVSGGFAIIPVLIAIVAKVVIPAIIEGYKHKHENHDPSDNTFPKP